MITVDDIGKVVLDRLAAVTSSATICPGGHWFARGPDDPAGYPYDVFGVSAGGSRIVSGDFYTQEFLIQIAGYCPVGATGVTVANVEKLFYDAITTDTANVALRAVSLRNTGEAVLHCIIATVDADYAPTLREGRDVFVAGMSARMVVLGRLDVT